MERYPNNIKDEETRYIIDRIFLDAFGNPILMQDVPDSNTMKANTWGKYSSDVYIRFSDGVILKLSGTVI